MNAYAFAQLASTYETNLSRTVMGEIMEESNPMKVEVVDIDRPEGEDWRMPITKHLESGETLES